ncbi:MAG: hypothetical protein Q9168_002922 [Polycauliona sp. 1 TL-2023]
MSAINGGVGITSWMAFPKASIRTLSTSDEDCLFYEYDAGVIMGSRPYWEVKITAELDYEWFTQHGYKIFHLESRLLQHVWKDRRLCYLLGSDGLEAMLRQEIGGLRAKAVASQRRRFTGCGDKKGKKHLFATEEDSSDRDKEHKAYSGGHKTHQSVVFGRGLAADCGKITEMKVEIRPLVHKTDTVETECKTESLEASLINTPLGHPKTARLQEDDAEAANGDVNEPPSKKCKTED